MKTWRPLFAIFALSFSFGAFAVEETTPEAVPAPAASYGARNPLLGDFAFAPHLSLVSVPTPKFGLDVKWRNMVGVSFEYGLVPTLAFGSVSVGVRSWLVAAKYFPWHRAFYFGVSFGNQTFTGSSTDAPLSLTVTATVNTTFVTPHFGWQWTGASGFFYGIQLGVQVPLANTTATTSNNPALSGLPAFAALQNSIDTYAQTYGRIPLPLLTLVQIGWYL